MEYLQQPSEKDIVGHIVSAVLGIIADLRSKVDSWPTLTLMQINPSSARSCDFAEKASDLKSAIKGYFLSMPAYSFIIASLCATLLSGCTEGVAGEHSTVERGLAIYTKECAQCHGVSGEGAGPASLGLGVAAPDLVGLTGRNGGYLPREFVRRFVLGSLEKDDPDAAMPELGRVGLQHVYPNGGPGAKALKTDIAALLDYLETIQR
tara:strand:- start:250 stop:870 length:621 start_codon:yes stop_codon:yes gene_type:complete